MDESFNIYRDMISLRGLTSHTVKSYSTYIRAYLDYLSSFLFKRRPIGTHLCENGTDLLRIKALLRHKAISSTAIYVHLASNGPGQTCIF